ncbi:hypothetical protein ASG47_18240 [Devosia sp. Leaf420]|uniref:hypothetical protein n=1 Tax=Devosia sp. Leaf420 TaxID=1736374 RepID=UPI00071360EF|nr:hypothetical protein [Devosia sp. Leaf420]KQT42850.1 hypothetical protein ASG47_18240 [Devosia sp. Leaf420]
MSKKLSAIFLVALLFLVSISATGYAFKIRAIAIEAKANAQSRSDQIDALRIQLQAAEALIPAPEPISVAWNLVTEDAPWEARDGAFVASFKGYIWLANGWAGTLDFPNPIYRSRDGLDWEEVVSDAPWQNRHLGNFVVLGDRMFMYGGDDMTDVWSSADGINWQLETDAAPWGERYSPYVGAFDGKLWLIGGIASARGTRLADVWSSPDGKNWTRVLERAPWPARGLISGFAVHDGAMWLIGGGQKIAEPSCGGCGQTLVELSDVWKSQNGADWQLVTANADWANRTHHSVAEFDGHLIVTDGSVGRQVLLSSEAWASPDGETWRPIGGFPIQEWGPRHASSLVNHNGSLYLIAGYLRNDVWRLDAVN